MSIAAIAFGLVKKSLDGDCNKALRWWFEPCQAMGLGYISPGRAVELGHEKAVLKFVKTTLKKSAP